MEGPVRAISRRGQRILRTVSAIGLILLLALVLAAVAGISAPVSAADTGLCSPSANSNVGWDSPWEAYTSNDWRARADRTEDIVQYYNFNLPAIPSGATVDGIEVRVEGYQDGGTTPRQAEISLSWDNGVSYTSGAGTGTKTTNMPGPNPWDEAVRTFGGSGDTWGRAWSSGDFVNANFRVKLDAILASSFHYLYIDHVQVRVYYRDGTTTAVASSSNPSTYGDSVTFTATVTRTSGASTPTGMVEFWDGATLLGTDTLSTVSNGVAEAALATSSLGAGSHSITAVYGGDSNFGGSSGSLGGGQTVNQRPITVTADAQSKVYGESDPALTYQITSGSLAFSDTFSGALSRVAGEDVGSYAIQQGTLTLSSNYNLTFVGANLSITARPITVTADAQSKVYGESDPALTYQITSGSLAFSDTFSGALSRVAGENVGSYAIQQGTLTLSSNYNLTFVGANLSITARPITVTADAQSKVYGESDPALTYQITSGSLAFSDTFSGALIRVAGEDVGSYAIQQGTLTLSSNYNLTFVGANLSITARPITVTADAQSKVYGDSDPALTYQITSGSLAFSDTFSGALSRLAGENVGSYDIQQGTLALSGNYNLTFVGANLSITARPITVTADAQSKVYGESDPALTYQITSGSLAFSDTFSGALSRLAGENVGSYDIQQGTLALSGNYNLTFVGANLSITAKSLAITANDRSKVYGDTVTFAGTEFVAIGLVNADAVASVTLTSAGTESSAPLGDYPIVPSAAVGTGLGNYDITYVNGTLAVRKGLTITANSRTKVYGDIASFAGTEFTVIGLESGDTVTGVTLTCAGTGAAGAAGIYDIVPSEAVGTGLSNYTIVYVNGTLTVNPRPLTIAANDLSKTYGGKITFAGTEFIAEGLVNSDTVTGVTLTCAGADAAGAAGICDIVPSEPVGTGLSNYTIVYVNGTLTVNPRPLTITANNRSKTYGDAVTFAGIEFIAEGLVDSDTVTGVTLTSAGADAAAASGIYDITPSAATGTGMGNYSITYVDGTFTVKKAITIWKVTSSPTRSSRGNTVTFTATVNDPGATGTVTFKDGGIVLGSGTLSNGEATWTTSDLSKGSHYITIVYDGDANFTEGSSLAHLHGVKTPAGFPWWIIVVIIAVAATGGLFFWLFLRRRRQQGQPASA